MSHLIQDRSYGSGRHSYAWRDGRSCNCNIRRSPFFRRPHIDINNIKCNPVNKISLTSDSSESFDGNVWTIRVKNKKYGPFSRNASKCKIELDYFKESIQLGTSIRLPWKKDRFPTACHYPSSLKSRNNYMKKLPFCYIGELIGEQTEPTLRKGEANEAMMVFTFHESNSAYIISQKTIGEDDVISIPFNELSNYEFLIKFYSDEYKDTRGKNFKLNATSWNDVKLKRV